MFWFKVQKQNNYQYFLLKWQTEMLIENINEKQSLQIPQIKAKQIIGPSGFSLFLRKPKICLDLLLDPANVLPQQYNSLNSSNEFRSLQEWKELTSSRVRMGLAKNFGVLPFCHSSFGKISEIVCSLFTLLCVSSIMPTTLLLIISNAILKIGN